MIIGLEAKCLFPQTLGKANDLAFIRITEAENHALNPVLPR